MSDPQPARRPARSFAAVFVGFVVVVILSIGTDIALRKFGIFPKTDEVMSNGLFLLATFYRTIYGVLGSYVTARLAPDRPMEHALTGGVVGLVLGIVGAVTTWNHVPSLGPHWYPIALIILALPTAWLGGKLYGAQRR